MSVSTHFFLFQQQKSWPLPSPNTNTYKFNLFHHNHLSRSKNSFVVVFVLTYLCRNSFLFKPQEDSNTHHQNSSPYTPTLYFPSQKSTKTPPIVIQSVPCLFHPVTFRGAHPAFLAGERSRIISPIHRGKSPAEHAGSE